MVRDVLSRSQAAAVLGVDESASRSEVEDAYRTQARLLHPDRWALFGESERSAAATAMERLNAARDVLLARRPPARAPNRGSGHGQAASPEGSGGPTDLTYTTVDAERLWVILRTARREWVAFADNPYAPMAWLVLSAAALITGLVGLFWLFLALTLIPAGIGASVGAVRDAGRTSRTR